MTKTLAPLSKPEAIEAIIRAAGIYPIVFTTGYSCRLAHAIADRPQHLYMTGSMGLCATVAAGLATTTKRAVVAVDGDGSLLMNPGALLIATMSQPLPLVHVLLDDGAYDSTGGQATSSALVNFGAWAKAAGYHTIEYAHDLQTLS